MKKNNLFKVLSLINTFVKAIVLITFIPCSVYSQVSNSLSVELLGSSTTVGIYYDARFSERTQWGVRVGIAYTNSSSQSFFDHAPNKTIGWTIPIAVNYLLGKNKHYAELGAGVSFGQYECIFTPTKLRHGKEEPRSGEFFFLDVGYRYQPTKGILLRVGLNPGFSINRMHGSHYKRGVDRVAVIYPYLGIGYSF